MWFIWIKFWLKLLSYDVIFYYMLKCEVVARREQFLWIEWYYEGFIDYVISHCITKHWFQFSNKLFIRIKWLLELSFCYVIFSLSVKILIFDMRCVIYLNRFLIRIRHFYCDLLLYVQVIKSYYEGSHLYE